MDTALGYWDPPRNQRFFFQLQQIALTYQTSLRISSGEERYFSQTHAFFLGSPISDGCAQEQRAPGFSTELKNKSVESSHLQNSYRSNQLFWKECIVGVLPLHNPAFFSSLQPVLILVLLNKLFFLREYHWQNTCRRELYTSKFTKIQASLHFIFLS